ncbi:MAG: DeoR/GlpR family DNA-binding transcription regulator [Bifidobacteriaceae bacterium]|jgi:DeoR/GlpR family transcriptional regulator of sugar metabolism|nr:DeoR/GlpR family DNA-binding transcription regulator [Bifidobacteriaceae bacterium]
MADSTPTSAPLEPSARRSEILSLIRAQGRVEVVKIPPVMGVSSETVRRDLRALESQGLIRRAYGLAYAVESGGFEISLGVRRNINPEEKQRVAGAIAGRLGEAQTIYMDEGFQMELVAQRLPTDRPLTIVTGSLPVATALARRSNLEVIVLGGRLRAATLAVADHWPATMLSKLTIDLAIMGANGISVERGLTTPDPAVAAVKETAMKAAIRHIFVGAHHKFSSASFVKFAEAQDFESLITGHELPTSIANRFTAAGCRLIRV